MINLKGDLSGIDTRDEFIFGLKPGVHTFQLAAIGDGAVQLKVNQHILHSNGRRFITENIEKKSKVRGGAELSGEITVSDCGLEGADSTAVEVVLKMGLGGKKVSYTCSIS